MTVPYFITLSFASMGISLALRNWDCLIVFQKFIKQQNKISKLDLKKVSCEDVTLMLTRGIDFILDLLDHWENFGRLFDQLNKLIERS
jgi:hypothetical protein